MWKKEKSITCSEIENLGHFRQKSKVYFDIYLLRWLDAC